MEKGEVLPACRHTGTFCGVLEVETTRKEALGAQLRHQNFPFEETMTDFFNIIDFEVFHSI